MQFIPNTEDSGLNSKRTCQYCDRKSFAVLLLNLFSVLIFSYVYIDNKNRQRVNKRFTVCTDASQSPQVCSTSPPKTWSVVEVVKFIEKSELAEHADMFRKHVSK